MPYQLVKELSPDCLLLQNEAGEELIFDRVPFAVLPRETLRKEIQKDLKEIVETEKPIRAAGLIKYINMEKYQDGYFLVRENSRPLRIKTVGGGNVEESCRALLHILKIMQVYHRDGMALGGISIGLIKQGGKNSYYLQDPLIFNYLWKSLEAEYQIERSPEIIEGHSWSMESDIFSWGVAAYYLLTGVEPYPATTPEEKSAKILRANVIPLNDHKPEISPLLNKLFINCLNKDPLKRPKVENLISQLTKLLEDQTVIVTETEAKKHREQSERNLIKFKFQESLWLWFRQYGKITGISLGIIIIVMWLFLGSKPKPTITASSTPDQVINYYFEGVTTINVLLVDEAIHKAKNDLSQMVSNIHVLNTTNKAVSPGTAEFQIKIMIEGLEQEKLSEKPEEVKYRIDYRVKVAAPKVVEYLERKDVFILKPVKKVWRITDIKVLDQKNWKEEIKPKTSTSEDGEYGSQEPGARSGVNSRTPIGSD